MYFFYNLNQSLMIFVFMQYISEWSMTEAFQAIAHWSSSVQKVITPDNAIKTGVKRFRQILKNIYKNISNFF